MAGLGSLGKLAMSLGRELFGFQIRANDKIADIAKSAGVTMDTLQDTPPEALSDILNRAARSGAIDPRDANSINIQIAKDAQKQYKDSFNIDAAHGQADANTSIGTTLVPRGDGTFREMMVEFEPGRTALDDENLGINRFVDVNEKDETLDPNNLGTWFGSYNSRGEPDIANFFAEREKSNNLSAGAVYPVKLKIENPKIFDRYEDFEDEMREWSEMAEESGTDVTSQAFVKDLQDQGHDGIMIERSDTDTGEVRSDYVPFNANQIRSIFAKFDPSKKDSGNISASIAGGAVGLGALQNAGDPK
jgi:hypothetical protein